MSRTRWVGAVLGLALMLAGCGDDAGTGSPSDDASSGTTDGGSDAAEAAADAIEIPGVPQDGESIPFENGFRVEEGAVLDMDIVQVTVSNIRAGSTDPVPTEDLLGEDNAGSVLADVEVISISDSLNLGPDVYYACVADGDLAVLAPDSEYVSLAEIEAGETVSSTAEALVRTGCADPVLQVRVLGLERGEMVAEIPIPADALP